MTEGFGLIEGWDLIEGDGYAERFPKHDAITATPAK